MFPLRKLTSLLLFLQASPPHDSSPFISLECTAQKTLMHTAHTLGPAKWIQHLPVGLLCTIAKKDSPNVRPLFVVCSPWMQASTMQCTQRRIYQGFYNIVCLTTHKHAARRVAQSKQAARSDTQRPLALLKRPTLGPAPGSHTATFKASTLPGVCQRRADMHKVHAERWGCVMNSSGGYEADKVSVSRNYVGKCWQKRRVSVGKGNTAVSVVL